MSEEIHALDIGTELRITITDDGVAVDLSTATTLEYLIRKPDGSLLTVNADLYTDGTDGILTYTTVDGDTDIAGLYKIQAKVTIGSGTFYSSSAAFKVHCNV
jgi:hypothetical protein